MTEVPVNLAHGTGCTLLRLFSGSGLNVINVYPATRHGGEATIPSVAVAEVKTPGLQMLGAVRGAARRVHPGLASHFPPVLPARYRITPQLMEAIAQADLVLAVIFSPYGLNFFHECLHGSASLPPVLLWFMDCELTPDIPESIGTFLQRLSPSIWALTPEIKTTLAKIFPAAADRIQVHFHLGVTLPFLENGKASPQETECRCVVIGTFWELSAASFLQKIWAQARAKTSLCKPLQWYAAPEAVRRLKEAGIMVEPEISYQGFARPLDLVVAPQDAPSLDSVLRNADLAVLPFSAADSPITDYARHSFPSRLADYCAYGLPVVALAHRHSMAANFVVEHGIGMVVDAPTPELAAAEISRYLSDPDAMRQHGRKARALAERLFDISKVRERFHADLEAAAGTHGIRQQR